MSIPAILHLLTLGCSMEILDKLSVRLNKVFTKLMSFLKKACHQYMLYRDMLKYFYNMDLFVGFGKYK